LRFTNLTDHDLLVLVQHLQAIGPEEQKGVDRRLRRLSDIQWLIPIVVEDHEAPDPHQPEGVDRVLQHVPAFVVPVDVGELEPRRQQGERPPRFGLELADLIRPSQFADVGVEPPLGVGVWPRVDACQRRVRVRKEILHDPDGAAAFVAADLQAAHGAAIKRPQMLLPEGDVRTVPVAGEFHVRPQPPAAVLQN